MSGTDLEEAQGSQTSVVERPSTDDDQVTELGGETSPLEEEEAEELGAPLRRALAPLVVAAGTAVVAGGVFSGIVGPRLYAIIAALIGGLLAYVIRNVRNFWVSNLLMLLSIFGTGVALAILLGGLDSALNIGTEAAAALDQARLVRPPIELTPGFAALLGWLMGGASFAAVWLSVVLRKLFLGLLAPLPVAAITAISIPDNAQLVSGMLLVFFVAAAIGIASGDRMATGGQPIPWAYELRRAVRAAPMLAGLAVALVLLARTGLLFPRPLINPEFEAQKPKTVPITEVPNRVLFEVQSSVTGPWTMGVLDVYDGRDWRLPPFSEVKLNEIPDSGVVNKDLAPALRATIEVRGLGGAVLPGLPNTVGIVARGPTLNYDSRTGSIRLVEGEINEGFTYRIAAGRVPTVDNVVSIKEDPPRDLLERFTQSPAPPAAAKALIDQAPKSSKWEEWDWLRRYVLDNVTASGAGSPVTIPVSRVQEILAVTKEGSPFEMVAIQTLFARWVGIPARIGYGFDGGDRTGDTLEVRPRHGASFPEVYFQGHGWIPVIGIPAKAKVTDTADPELQQLQEGVLPSEDISVTIFRPVELPAATRFYERIRDSGLVVLAVLLIAVSIYVLNPIGVKAVRRSRRRARAMASGPRARILQAYSEWRDTLTDLGYRYQTDTPLMLLKRFPRDEEHSQLAWLVTRVFWGDLRKSATLDLAIHAEEMSRSMRRRLVEAHPLAMRMVAAISRLSLRSPFSTDLSIETSDREELEDRVA